MNFLLLEQTLYQYYPQKIKIMKFQISKFKIQFQNYEIMKKYEISSIGRQFTKFSLNKKYSNRPEEYLF